MIAVGVGILVALVATVVFFVVYNSSRKGWQQSLAVRESEAADLKVRNGVLEAQVKSCTARLAEVQAQLDFANREREKLNREKGDLQARNQMLSENMEVQKQEVQRIRQDMNNEFKVLANEILQEKSKSFSEMNHERLAEILNPLKERLEGFKKTVEETYNNEARERFSLKEQIKELVERSESIGAEAKQLTHALRGDSKIQGDWGEMILESILEKSGLEKDREYFIQETLRDEEGHTIQGSDGRKMRPDVIIRYPGGENHQMVIDSKVSLTAYVNYVNAEDADEARLALKQHLVSVEVQKQEVQRIRQDMNNEFKVLANEILQEKSKSFSEMNHERLAEILNPLKERLEGFKKTVEETYNNEARERFSLKEQIKELVERSESIGAEAKQLTHALRGDSKIQGDWGEMILESILEKSGLEKDREYFIQETLRDEEGHTIQGSDGRKMRPDVIIRYPGGENHQMVIDSKVSLTAYVNYVNAEDADEARLALKQHLVSVRKHIDELAGKSYQDYVGKGDHVMMFIPNEAAYLAAMQADHALWQYAYEKKVLLLSPTNLIAALKLVADLWQRDKQTRNAIDIAEEGGKLYDKFAGFVEDMEKIGKSLNTTAMAYTDAMKKLKTGNGNLIGRVEKLKVMGVKAKKNLPAVNEEEEEN